MKITVRQRLVLWRGVLRRYIIYFFRRKYMEKSYSYRRGSCLRCGACCKLAFRVCPYLRIENRMYSCAKHATFRPPNCAIFPINASDIRDRNIVSKKPCGYYMVEKGAGEE